MTIENPEKEPISEQLKTDLKRFRGDLSSLLNDYIEEIPENTVSGKLTHKCQVGWFSDISGCLSNIDGSRLDKSRLFK